MKFIGLLAIGMLFLTIGCIVTEKTVYVCPDGSEVENQENCSAGLFKETVYVCPDGSIVEEPTSCTTQYVCPDGKVVEDTRDCDLTAVPPTINDEYWSEEAEPFRFLDYKIAGETLFLTVKNAGSNTLEFTEARFDGILVRLGFIDTTFAPGEEKPVSGNIIGASCGEEGDAYSYVVSLNYNNLNSSETGLKQIGEKKLSGKCTEMPKAVVAVSCTGSEKDVNGTIKITNSGVEAIPANSMNIKAGSITTKIEHTEIPPGSSINLLSGDVNALLTSGVQGEAWITGATPALFVCLE
ncbi:hypothetical protein K8R43_02585 [archaeon]|nr:hypothetical protein [archaeon]